MKKFLVLILLYCFAHINVHGMAAADNEDKTKPAPPVSAVASPQTEEEQVKNPDYVKKLKEAKLPELQLSKYPKRRVGRALLEGFTHLIYATSSYWIRQDVMKEDWEYQFTWKDQRRRYLFIDGMRFDSNTFEFNWTHAWAGAIYYNFGRSNHMSPVGSFLYSLAMSTTWEFLVEFREVVSINDMIFTPVGGFSIGECFFQLGRFFRSQKGTLFNRIGRFVSNPILTLSDWLDHKKYKNRNQYAITEDFWHDCNFNLGPRFDVMQTNTTNPYGKIGMETQLILIPEYGFTEEVSRGVKKTLFTEFDLDLTIGQKGIYEMDAFCKAVFFGHFQQHIHSATLPDKTGDETTETLTNDRVGYSFFLGGGTAYSLVTQNPEKVSITKDDQNEAQYKYLIDRLSIVHLFGPTFDYSLFQKDFTLRFTADAYLDFSLTRSHAYQRYADLHTIGQTKSTLKNHGYYYGLGFSLYSTLQMDYANLQLKGKIKYHWADSVENLDRFQKDMPDENDFDLQDQRFYYNIGVGYRIPRTDLQAVVGFEQIDYRGTIEDFSQHHREHRYYLQFKYMF